MTFFDQVFDPEIIKATVQCPGCGRRLRCSCPACMEMWTEDTNAPGVGFTVELTNKDPELRLNMETGEIIPLGDFEECNDCGYFDFVDNWSQRSDHEIADREKYGELAECVIV